MKIIEWRPQIESRKQMMRWRAANIEQLCNYRKAYSQQSANAQPYVGIYKAACYIHVEWVVVSSLNAAGTTAGNRFLATWASEASLFQPTII